MQLELPNFMDKFLQTGEFSSEEWRKVASEVVQSLENLVCD